MSVRARVCITLRMCVLGHCQRYKNFVITSISTNLKQLKKKLKRCVEFEAQEKDQLHPVQHITKTAHYHGAYQQFI